MRAILPGHGRFIRDLGYKFSPPDREHAPGGQQLIIKIHHQPTYHHFDPEHVIISAWTEEGYPDTLTLHHPWTFGEEYRGYPGRIHMIDRRGEEAHAFSFGGQWLVQSQEDLTLLKLSSTAPILDCNPANMIVNLLADEVEVLMAEQRALRRTRKIDPLRTARVCDPMTVYTACLQSLSQKYRRLEATPSPSILKFHQFLETEIAVLEEQGLMPAGLPQLNCLF